MLKDITINSLSYPLYLKKIIFRWFQEDQGSNQQKASIDGTTDLADIKRIPLL